MARLLYEILNKNSQIWHSWDICLWNGISRTLLHTNKTYANNHKKSEPSFQIVIKSSADHDFKITLQVTFVATYPKSLPILLLKDDDDLRDSTKFRIQKVLETKTRELAARGQEMVADLVMALQDILEDAAAAKAAGKELPSLEEERANHEAEAAKLAKEQEEEEQKKKQLETQEEERMLQDMVQDELKRQRAKVKEAKRKSRPLNLTKELSLDEDPEDLREKLVFDQPVTLLDEENNPRLFQVVSEKTRIRHGAVSDCFTVKAIVRGPPCERLALKQTELNSQEKDTTQFKNLLRALEADLESLKKARHRNILELLGFKIDKDSAGGDLLDPTWTISILSEFANKGSLEELLDIAGSLGVEKVRAWTIELLDALRYLHDRGIVHQDLHSGNIMLIRSSTGSVTPKIADAAYQRQLHDLKRVRSTSNLEIAKTAYWLPPENANSSKPQYTQKTDVWDFGVIFLQMTFGLTVLQKYASPDRLTEALVLSEPLNEILHKFFKSDPRKRPRAFELSSSEFLATDAPIMADNISTGSSRYDSVTSLMPTTPGRQRRESSHAPGPFSRWKFDFTEVSRLGKGGFGEVVKARKKLDGQFYAIKTITQKSSSSLTEILKEVRLLSQLSHPYVVRYYNTWTEEVSDSTETDDETTSTFDESNSVISPSGGGPDIEFGASTGGLDFISSSGYPQIEFGYGSDEDSTTEADDDDEYDEEDDSTNPSNPVGNGGAGRGLSPQLVLKRTRSDSRFQRSTKTILYIQ
jgi:translation initiation factor 2-alpha kinase 4